MHAGQWKSGIRALSGAGSVHDTSLRIDRALQSSHSERNDLDSCHMPRVLIADDDPVSLRFLAAALAQSGCEVVAVGDGAAALAAVQTHEFDLLLLDRRMPDLGGAELLVALRARGAASPAIATSAEVDAVITVQLRAAGFNDIIEKPTTLARLQHITQAYLHFSSTQPAATKTPTVPALLDNAAALAAIGGDAETLRALRGLLAQELATLENELRKSDPFAQPEYLRECLHRLRASCGFCGAPALSAAAARLEQVLHVGATNAQSTLVNFVRTCRDTAAALHG